MITNRIKELQTALVALVAEAVNLDKDETKKAVSADLEARYKPTGGYESPYPVLFGRLHMEVTRMSYRAENLTEVIRDLELMERLLAVMERFEVYANIGFRGEDNTRELRLLEILAENDEYDYERRQLESAIAKALNGVEESEWEKEYEGAIETMEAAGFERVEDDILDGWRRTVDGVVEEVVIEIVRKNRDFGYKFEYEKKLPSGAVLLNGKSGEFKKLLEVAGIAAPVAA